MRHRKRRYTVRDLKELGYGSRNTIIGKIKKGQFPAPLADESGHLTWTHEMLVEADASLESYHCKPIAHLSEARKQ